MSNVAIPSDLNALLTLILSQAWISILISLLATKIWLIRKDEVADWIKVVIISLGCLLWSFFATVKSLGHLPASPDEIYLVAYLTLVVLFTNQAYYGLVTKVFPVIGDFIQALFGKTSTVTVSTVTNNTTSKMLGSGTTTTVSAELAPPAPEPVTAGNA